MNKRTNNKTDKKISDEKIHGEKKSYEQILCFKKNRLPEEWVRKKSIVKSEEDYFFNVCSKAGFQWVNRNNAETDTSFKQIIPYIILQTTNKEKTAVYKRHGTETRLHDLWSCGIGGHINPEDNLTGSASFKEILFAGLERELNEELIQRPEYQIPVFAGIINEETSEVGSVHIGVVFRLITPTPAQFLPGTELKDFQWENTDNLDSLNMELWSKLALELISKKM